MTADTVNVWRMERTDGAGPFNSFIGADFKEMARHIPWMHFEADFFSENIIPDPTHPHHREDVLGWVPNRRPDGSNDYGWAKEGSEPVGCCWTVGVKDPAQMLYWFPSASMTFFQRSEHMRVRCYTVPKDAVMYGTYQLMFKSNAAKLEEDLTPTEFAKRYGSA